MNPATLTACLVLPLALSPRDELPNTVAVDDVRTRQFTVETETSLDELAVEIDGQEMDPSMMGEMSMTDRSSFELEVVDTVLAVEDGRATKISRLYSSGSRSIAHAAEMPGSGEESSTLEGSTSLADREVVFELEDGEFVASFAEGKEAEGDELDGLFAELDLAQLLPPGEVAVGDTWEIDPDVIVALQSPGGVLPMEDEVEGNEELLERRATGNERLQDYDGSFQAEYKGMVEIDGEELASIELTCELEAAVDLTELLADAGEADGAPEGMEVDIASAELEHELEGGGTLLWDVAGGRLRSLELELEVLRIGTTEIEITMGENVMSQVQSMSSSGTTRITVEFD